MTKDKIVELKKLWTEYAQSFNHLTEFVAKCEMEANLKGNTNHYISFSRDNVLYSNFFLKSLKIEKAVPEEPDTTNLYIFKISLSELQEALKNGKDEKERAEILKVPVIILQDAIKYYKSKGLL